MRWPQRATIPDDLLVLFAPSPHQSRADILNNCIRMREAKQSPDFEWIISRARLVDMFHIKVESISDLLPSWSNGNRVHSVGRSQLHLIALSACIHSQLCVCVYVTCALAIRKANSTFHMMIASASFSAACQRVKVLCVDAEWR